MMAEHAQQFESDERERSSAERALQGVWEAVTEQAMVTTDLNGLILGWNPGAEKLSGVSAAQAENKRQVVEFFAAVAQGNELRPEIEQPAFSALVGVATTGGAQAGEWRMLGADGTRIPVHLTVTARLEPAGEVVGYMFVAINMTETVEVARLKDEFVSLISHELRTPLSSIIGYLELLREEETVGLTTTQLQYVAVAERNAHRLLRLVGDLLFTAQVEAGSFYLDKRELDLAQILGASAESASPVAASAGVTVVLGIAPGVIVEGDPVRLGQAIDNLMSNAIKYTPRGGTVTLSLASNGSQAVVTVADNGMGIAADEMDKLFGRFFRATTATTNAVPGIGLGLTITRAIVTAHRGAMNVASEEGVGTSFSFSLPLVRVLAAAS